VKVRPPFSRATIPARLFSTHCRIILRNSATLRSHNRVLVSPGPERYPPRAHHEVIS
jgi:hypothetical protein